MGTPKDREIIEILPGKYIHMEVANGLDWVLRDAINIPEIIEIDVNVDVVPICKSNTQSFWLITARSNNHSRRCPCVHTPKSAIDFLTPFVEGMILLQAKCIINHKIHFVKMRLFICDTPYYRIIIERYASS
jgi:hypothetical protein